MEGTSRSTRRRNCALTATITVASNVVATVHAMAVTTADATAT
jgi:hypothetical protein